MKHFWLPTLGILFIGCDDTKLNYKCTCTQIAVGAGDNGEDIDQSFSENICDTYENIEAAFAPGGEIYQGLETCETNMQAYFAQDGDSQTTEDSGTTEDTGSTEESATTEESDADQENTIVCECDCIYQSEC